MSTSIPRYTKLFLWEWKNKTKHNSGLDIAFTHWLQQYFATTVDSDFTITDTQTFPQIHFVFLSDCIVMHHVIIVNY